MVCFHHSSILTPKIRFEVEGSALERLFILPRLYGAVFLFHKAEIQNNKTEER